MIVIIMNFICSLIATIGFAIYFNISRKIILLVGLTGALGWIINYYLLNTINNTAISFLVASMAVSFFAEFLAIKTKNPSTIFSIPGIYPLVPGYTLYITMRYFIMQDIPKGMETLIDAFIKAGAIALGIIIISTLSSLRKKIIMGKFNKGQNR